MTTTRNKGPVLTTCTVPEGCPTHVSIEPASKWHFLDYKHLGVRVNDPNGFTDYIDLDNVVEFDANAGWYRGYVKHNGKPKMERGKYVAVLIRKPFEVYWRSNPRVELPTDVDTMLHAAAAAVKMPYDEFTRPWVEPSSTGRYTESTPAKQLPYLFPGTKLNLRHFDHVAGLWSGKPGDPFLVSNSPTPFVPPTQTPAIVDIDFGITEARLWDSMLGLPYALVRPPIAETASMIAISEPLDAPAADDKEFYELCYKAIAETIEMPYDEFVKNYLTGSVHEQLDAAIAKDILPKITKTPK